MSYQSPIEVIQSQIDGIVENEIYKAVLRVGVNVDKEELIRALKHDRAQYQKGYEDRDSEIVRCKDCKEYQEECEWDDKKYCTRLGYHYGDVPPDWFCADGERLEDEDEDEL